MPDYSKTIIYKLCCKDTEITDIYIGSTVNFKLRKCAHKSRYNNENDINNNLKVYQFIRENGGWENWTMIMINEFHECQNKLQKESKEREYIELLKPSLNSCIPTRTVKEWREMNKDSLKDKKREYYENNKDKIKEYYENNKEKIREYREVNKETISQKLKVKFNCECGSNIRISDKARHFKTIKHIKFINNGK